MDTKYLDLEKTIKNNSVTLVFFSASWCGPCKVMTPIIHEIATEFKDKIGFFNLNVDTNPSIALNYGIMGVPTSLFIKDGKIIEKVSGIKTKNEFVEKLIYLLS
jgi:thioredoxin 1